MKNTLEKYRPILSLVSLLLFFCAIYFGFLLTVPAYATELSAIAYNVESGEDTDPLKVAEDLEKIAGVDLWGLSEVGDREAAEVFTQAVAYPGADFESILGTTGGSDKLQIVYDRNRLRAIESYELKNTGGTRSPLVARFQLLSSGTEFLFMVNHFDRANPEKGNKQANRVRQWAEEQSLPILAVGDYNFDLDAKSRKGNEGFDTFMAGQTFQWIEPDCWRKGTCPATGTQCNPNYTSILDFVFVAGAAQKWQGTSQILFLDDRGYCDWDESGYSDHRPIKVTFNGDF